ncbi:MAG TPA: DUF2059 domain-containing protein [Candidatus Acidoferrum sp.]|jgi:hypothetical protein
MKAVLALVVIYVAAFLVAIQGASPSSAQAQSPAAGSAPAPAASIDPAKEADIRSLIELLGVHDAVQEAAARNIEQFHDNLQASVPDNDHGRKFVAAFIQDYQAKFNADDLANQLLPIYDKHFTEDEIKGLLQFYGSPLGQKLASEMPKLNSEMQTANRAANTRLAREVLRDLRRQYPVIVAEAKLTKPRSGQADPSQQQASATQP